MNYPELKSERLHLRQLKKSDTQLVFKYRSDSITNQYQGFIPKTVEEVDEWIGKISTEYNIIGSWAQLAIILEKEQILIGDLGIHFIDDKQLEIGCTIAKAYHKKGFAKEAIKCLIDHFFQKQEKHRMITSIDPNNMASIKLVESLGFIKEAHFRKSIYMDGKWHDDLIYALLKSDWK